MNTAKYAQVVLGVPIDKAFTYSIPKRLQEFIQLGQKVEVPFAKDAKLGYVVNFINQTSLKKVKPLKAIIEQRPLLDAQMLKLTRQVADYYCACWGEVIEAAIPANIRNRKTPLPFPEPKHQQCPAPEQRQISQGQQKLLLNPQQKKALQLITKSMRNKTNDIFLLHGITASGKTEVYLQALSFALAQGESGIVLVPEISLTPQTVERFKLRFGEKVALMHSRLLTSERTTQWQMIKSGEAQIVIGARSAIFAPVKNLGLIVIDEEHETTYKQKETSPRYHAREVAYLRAKLTRATVVLGSATPSLESFYNAKKGKIKLLSLPQRVTKRDLPQVTIVDMRREIGVRKKRLNILSRTLEAKIEKIILNREQAILFLNRRGFSTFISCPNCGYVAKCKRCNVSLTHHYATKKLTCHYCNYNIEPPRICPQCSRCYLRYFGLGTEKVESELHRLFPLAQISRMDTDTTAQRGAHKKILGEFKTGKIDILIGTQMVAKGLDFPRVSLVGVICADTALNLPDFRSGERTFNLLTQVAGRSGRGEREGEVVIQTYIPKHYAIIASIRHDYHQFFQREIESRKDLKLPPFSHLVSLTLRSRSQEKLDKIVVDLSKRIKKNMAAHSKDIRVLGPAPAMVSKIRGNYRWNILLKGKNLTSLVKLIRVVLKDFKRYKGIPLSVDVDPI